MGMGLLADCCANGWAIPRDDAEAVTWYQKAIEGGYTPSLCRLGVVYSEGRGVPQDQAEAVRLWRKTADAGDAEAMGRLGLSFVQGRGVPQDMDEGLHWLLEPARAGDLFGMVFVAKAYMLGAGVPQDPAEAVYWMQKAADASAEDAREWLDDNAEGIAATELHDPNSDIRLPTALGPLGWGKITNFEADQPGLGSSIGYSSAAVKGTVYLYTMGFETIPDGIDSVPVRSAFAGAMRGIEVQAAREKFWNNLSPFATDTVALDPGTGACPALYARFSVVVDGVPHDSAL